jgi:UDP-glucose 4-epimerase
MRRLENALVLGAGFLGSWLLETLEREGVSATAVDHAPASLPNGVRPAELIVGDVTEVDVVGLIQEHSVDVVFHLANAASVQPSLGDPSDDLRRNVATTLAVLEALRSASRTPLLVFVSSAAVYGNAQILPMSEDHPLEPMSPYGVSKLMAEEYVRLYNRLYGIPAVCVRPFSIYGPRQRKQVIYDWMVRTFDGEQPLEVLGSPDVSRDFVFVRDAAQALLTIARTAPARGEPYNVASGKETTLGELAETLRRVTRIETDFEFSGQVRTGDPLRWTGDPSRARELGAECATRLEDGLRLTAEWYARARESNPVP